MGFKWVKETLHRNAPRRHQELMAPDDFPATAQPHRQVAVVLWADAVPEVALLPDGLPQGGEISAESAELELTFVEEKLERKPSGRAAALGPLPRVAVPEAHHLRSQIDTRKQLWSQASNDG